MPYNTLHSPRAPHWSTSSLGHPADISPRECSALGEHLNLCTRLRGSWRALRGGVDTLQSLLAAHVVTAVVVVSLLVLAVWLVR